ncbi:MAG: hypothetical protein V4813_04640 [Gemmatimonadota bacterium]
MTVQPETSSVRTGLMAFGILLIIASLGRLAVVLPDWLAGAPAAYPGQYERRLFSVLTSVPMLSAVLLMQSTGNTGPVRRRHAIAWALLAISVIAMIVEALHS